MNSRHTAALAGFQPRRPHDTLSRPLRDLRISVTDRCNFRCPYCMPRERFHEHYKFLKSSERLSFEEIVRLTRLFLQLGARKLRITGGEPLLRAGLAELIGDLTSLPGVDDVALTTNGVLLPQHAAELRAAGLQRVTVSLDSLDPAVFARMAGDLGNPEEVLAGISAAQRAGLAPIKVNAVVQRGVNDHTVLPLLEHFRGTAITVRLIEYMDVGNRNEWQRAQVVPSRELLELISARWPLVPLEREHVAEVAERHAYADGAGEMAAGHSLEDGVSGVPLFEDGSRVERGRASIGSGGPVGDDDVAGHVGDDDVAVRAGVAARLVRWKKVAARKPAPSRTSAPAWPRRTWHAVSPR